MIRILNFIPIQESHTIILHNDSQNTFLDVYQTSIDLAQLFDAKIIFNFGAYDYTVENGTTMQDINKQHKFFSNIDYSLYVENTFQSIIENLSVNNIKSMIYETTKLIDYDNSRSQIGLEKSIHSYQLNKLSKKLFNTYKSMLPDPYLDDMVEQAKVLKKTNM